MHYGVWERSPPYSAPVRSASSCNTRPLQHVAQPETPLPNRAVHQEFNISFTKAVQSETTSKPTHKSWTEDEWSQLYSKEDDGSDRDALLYEMGIWVNTELAYVRSLASKPVKADLVSEYANRWLIAVSNREYKVLTDAQQALGGNSAEIVLPGARIGAPLPIGPENSMIDTQGLLDGKVDALRYVMADARRNTPPDSRPTFEDLHTALMLRLTAAGAYDAIEGLWQELLWTGLRRTTRNRNGNRLDVFHPHSPNDELRSAVTSHRQEALMLEMTISSAALWEQDRFFRESRTSLLHTVVPTRSKKNYNRRSMKSPPNTIPMQMVAQIIAEELYWNDLLLEELPKFNNVTIRGLLDAWHVVAELSRHISKSHPSTQVTSVAALNRFAEIVTQQSLIDLLTGLVSEPDLAVKVLTYPRELKDPWYYPLVRTGDGKYVIHSAVAESSNLIRVIEHWMRAGGLDLAARGHVFESYVRERVAKYNPSVRLQGRFHVWPGSTTIAGEQIDLMFRVGSLLVIGESKCQVFPSTPAQRFRYHRTLRGAAKQAVRKADVVSQNLDKVTGLPTGLQDRMTVVPIVVSNLPLGVGFPAEGVPVCDLRILRKGICDTHVDFLVDARTRTPKSTVPILPPDANIEESFERYLKSPPQARFLDQYAKWSWYELPSRTFKMTRMRLRIDLSTLEDQLNARPS